MKYKTLANWTQSLDMKKMKGVEYSPCFWLCLLPGHSDYGLVALCDIFLRLWSTLAIWLFGYLALHFCFSMSLFFLAQLQDVFLTFYISVVQPIGVWMCLSPTLYFYSFLVGNCDIQSYMNYSVLNKMR